MSRIPTPLLDALLEIDARRRYPQYTIWWTHEETACDHCGLELSVSDRPVTDALHRRSWVACGRSCADALRGGW